MSDIPITDDAKTQLAHRPISYNEIASKLLNDRFLLTALELHTELIEAGKELGQLKDFFSNPTNFELQTQEPPTFISRSGSQATLDSLDLTRYSEDDERGSDEKVAILEFELRKAKETISALRNNLTVATEAETSSPNKSNVKQLHTGAIKPHEQRALNFLINEYLLLHNYKLTSITFADENENQDFEDWDDVGLNISKPAELLTLYREGLRQTGQNCISLSCQTDFESEFEKKSILLADEVQDLKLKITKLESQLCDIKNENTNLQKKLLSSQSTYTQPVENPQEILNNSTGSNTPERFEIIEKSNFTTKKRDSIITLDDNISNHSLNTMDWANVTVKVQEGVNKDSDNKKNEEISNLNGLRNDQFCSEVFSSCYINISDKLENELSDGMSQMLDNEVVYILTRTLLQIVPNIILNKREEVIPLIIKAVYINPNAIERDKLLQLLFNLKKRPSEAERSMILNGIVEIAKTAGESLVETEILPLCWEQLTHKYLERRLLVAESCNVLIPYISSPFRNSLLLSMFKHLLEDKEEAVREIVVKSLSLVVMLCKDDDKYSQCEEVAFNILNDSCISIVNITIQILFPVLGKWALKTGQLRSDLIKHLLQKLNEYLKEVDTLSKDIYQVDKIVRIISVLEQLLPFVLVSVLNNDSKPFALDSNKNTHLSPSFVKFCTNLTNPMIFNDTDINMGSLIHEFDKFIADNPSSTWPELDWIVDIVIPDLLNNLNHIDITNHAILSSFINLFSRICLVFGKNFAKYKIRLLFESHLQSLEQIVSGFNQFLPNLNIIPVYLVSVLSYCDDVDELSNVFTKFLFILPLCGTPLDCLEITANGLCELNFQEIVISCLWQGVVHQRPLVRAASATLFASIVGMCNEHLVCSKIAPALVTLASDNDVLVRTATITALGSLVTDCEIPEVNDKAYMQIQSYIADESLRDNHTLLRQLIVTLGNISKCCKSSFKHEVILPQLSALSAFMSQMSNQTRKVDMALALVEAFSSVVYSSLNKESSLIILPGLRCLESVVTQNPSLSSYFDTVLSMIKECDNKIDSLESTSSTTERTMKLSQNVNQGVEEMRQKVSKIFNKPANIRSSSLSNLQGIFKKK